MVSIIYTYKSYNGTGGHTQCTGQIQVSKEKSQDVVNFLKLNIYDVKVIVV